MAPSSVTQLRAAVCKGFLAFSGSPQSSDFLPMQSIPYLEWWSLPLLTVCTPQSRASALGHLLAPQPHVMLSYQQNCPAGALIYTQSSFLGLICNLLPPLCPVLHLVSSCILFKTTQPFPAPGSLSGSSWLNAVLTTTS